MIIGSQPNARRIGEGDAAHRHGRRRRPQRRHLRVVVRARRRVGAGEMAVQRVDVETGQQREVARGDAEPVDPGVEHDVAQPPGCRVAPRRDLRGRAQHRHRVAGERDRHFVRLHAVQHRQPRPRRHRQLGRLGPRRDEEIAATGGGQSIDHRLRAEAVAVGLDRGTCSSRAAQPRACPPIMGDGGAVDRQSEVGGHGPPRLRERGGPWQSPPLTSGPCGCARRRSGRRRTAVPDRRTTTSHPSDIRPRGSWHRRR